MRSRYIARLGISLFLGVMTLGAGESFARPEAGFARPNGLLSQAAQTPGHAEIVWTKVPGPNKKCVLSEKYYFKYEFNEKPKMGTVILKIRVFDKNDAQAVPFKIIGRSDMPSMKGAHDSGDVEFKLNRKNDYLMPLNVVMPGDWEVRVVFFLNDKAVFHGSIRFDV